MAEPRHVRPLFKRLMPLTQEAFDARHYDTAYHLLAAALHAWITRACSSARANS